MIIENVFFVVSSEVFNIDFFDIYGVRVVVIISIIVSLFMGIFRKRWVIVSLDI